MSETTSTEADQWPCPHCLQPLQRESTDGGAAVADEGDDLVIDLPAGWVCPNDACPSKTEGYHPDEGAKQRVLMLIQATRGGDAGTGHGG
jgi:hypothetical protein